MKTWEELRDQCPWRKTDNTIGYCMSRDLILRRECRELDCAPWYFVRAMSEKGESE